MNETKQVKDRVPPRGGTRRPTTVRYPTEFKLVLEGGFTQALVCPNPPPSHS